MDSKNLVKLLPKRERRIKIIVLQGFVSWNSLKLGVIDNSFDVRPFLVDEEGIHIFVVGPFVFVHGVVVKSFSALIVRLIRNF
ncbi:hypothetical protein RCL_jg28602.t1 [Rhizophagus clarus]|uniref:Uncharacterized protein n=1 Tax=Rhizophagus clarus TaxID=94130 RepID=A0A8H3QU38_9GLOM|nr:hypothetical protein RCL_jg28602.t1 [Rhizophagus clarus]